MRRGHVALIATRSEAAMPHDIIVARRNAIDVADARGSAAAVAIAVPIAEVERDQVSERGPFMTSSLPEGRSAWRWSWALGARRNAPAGGGPGR